MIIGMSPGADEGLQDPMRQVNSEQWEDCWKDPADHIGMTTLEGKEPGLKHSMSERNV